MPVASVLTKCLEEVSRIPAIHPGMFKPKCDENGNYMPLQCYGSIGYCWCVFPNGTEVPHTRSRKRSNCSGKQWPLCQGLSKEQEGPGRLKGKRSLLAHVAMTLEVAAPWEAASQPCIHPFVHPPTCAFLICLSIYFSPDIHAHVLIHLSFNLFIIFYHPCTIHLCIQKSYRSIHLISSPPSWPFSQFPNYTSWLPFRKHPPIQSLPSQDRSEARLGRTSLPRQWVRQLDCK